MSKVKIEITQDVIDAALFLGDQADNEGYKSAGPCSERCVLALAFNLAGFNSKVGMVDVTLEGFGRFDLPEKAIDLRQRFDARRHTDDVVLKPVAFYVDLAKKAAP